MFIVTSTILNKVVRNILLLVILPSVPQHMTDDRWDFLYLTCGSSLCPVAASGSRPTGQSGSPFVEKEDASDNFGLVSGLGVSGPFILRLQREREIRLRRGVKAPQPKTWLCCNNQLQTLTFLLESWMHVNVSLTCLNKEGSFQKTWLRSLCLQRGTYFSFEPKGQKKKKVTIWITINETGLNTFFTNANITRL